MNEPPDRKPSDAGSDRAPTLAGQIGDKAARKLKARRNPTPGVWFGLGMMGLIGWSVVVPTLLGAALGLWLDEQHPGTHSWTLALLVAGSRSAVSMPGIGSPRKSGRCAKSRRMAMNDRADCWCWQGAAGPGARGGLLRRPLVDAAQEPRLPAAGAVDFGQPAGADERAAGRLVPGLRRSLATPAGRSRRRHLRAFYRPAADRPSRPQSDRREGGRHAPEPR
jgi:ATP synthase protein I